MNVLVIGATGLLGNQVYETFSNTSHAVAGTFRSTDSPHFSYVDVTDPASIRTVVETTSPDVVVNAAAFADVDRCERQRKTAWDVNVSGVKHLGRICEAHDCHLLQISSAYVYPGAHESEYSESDPVGPRNYYGKTKLASEYVAKQFDIPVTIARTTVLYGPNPSITDFVTWLVDSISNGESVEIVDDQFSNPTYTPDLANALLKLIEDETTGTYNVVGPECCSRYQLAQYVAEAGGFDESLITPVSSLEFGQIADRPRQNCLATDTLETVVDYRLRSPQDVLPELAANWETASDQ